MPLPTSSSRAATGKSVSFYYAAITWGLVLLACLYIGSSLVRLYQDKRLLEDQMAQQLRNISVSMQRSLGLQLSALYAVQDRVGDQISDYFPVQLEGAGTENIQRLTQLLTQEAVGNDDIDLLGVADRYGKVRYLSTDVTSFKAGDQIDVAAFRDNPGHDAAVGIYLGGPGSTWSNGFLIVRPVRYADGNLKAFVFAVQSDDSFLRRISEQMRSGFSLGKDIVISIYESASKRLAFRYPQLLSLQAVGEPMPSAVSVPFRQGSQLSYMVSPYDHIKRLVQELPVVNGTYTLRVGAAESDYLAPWYAQIVSTAISALLLISALVLLVVLVRRSSRQAADLAYDKTQLAIGARTLRRLIDSAPMALAKVRQSDGKLLSVNPAFNRLFKLMPGQSVSVASALFADTAEWEKLCAELELASDGTSLECALKIDSAMRHAVVSAVALPTKRNAQQELLLTFTDVEKQYVREQALANIAYTDTLTGLPNRRAFFEQADAAFAVASRYSRPLAILMIDLDHFKRVNDSYGHAAGDLVLARTANCMRQCLREADLPARLGGEEFVVMLPETPLANAMEAAERIRQAIEQEPPVIFEGNSISVTASVGVAMLNMGSNDIQSIIQQADDALYQAKHAGRNRVVSAVPVD